jgi:hypothetical protein
MDVILFRAFSHMIIMTGKVDPQVEKGVGILIKENSIKVVDTLLRLKKSSTERYKILPLINSILFFYFLGCGKGRVSVQSFYAKKLIWFQSYKTFRRSISLT